MIVSAPSSPLPHPAALLVLSMALLLSVQFWPWYYLAVLTAMIVLAASAYRQKWLSFIRRNRWLILSLFLILSYGLPGEGLGGIDLLPSKQGIHEALIQSWRLITMLGVLACLMTHCHQQALLLGLHTLLRPLQKIGVSTERSIVRLSLVLADLDKSRSNNTHWQTNLLAVFGAPAKDAYTIEHIDIPTHPWKAIDTGLCVLALTVLWASASTAT